jgi:hypothetical protein
MIFCFQSHLTHSSHDNYSSWENIQILFKLIFASIGVFDVFLSRFFLSHPMNFIHHPPFYKILSLFRSNALSSISFSFSLTFLLFAYPALSPHIPLVQKLLLPHPQSTSISSAKTAPSTPPVHLNFLCKNCSFHTPKVRRTLRQDNS